MTLENLSYIVVILGSIATGSYFLLRMYNEKRKYYRKKLHDKWHNEGDILLSQFETHFIDLELEIDIDSGEIIGVLNSRNLETDLELKNISTNGKLLFRTGKIELSNVVRDGKLIKYGKLKLKLDKHGNKLTLKKIEGDSIFLPEKTVLWKEDKHAKKLVKKILKKHNDRNIISST